MVANAGLCKDKQFAGHVVDDHDYHVGTDLAEDVVPVKLVYGDVDESNVKAQCQQTGGYKADDLLDNHSHLPGRRLEYKDLVGYIGKGNGNDPGDDIGDHSAHLQLAVAACKDSNADDGGQNAYDQIADGFIIDEFSKKSLDQFHVNPPWECPC